MSHNATLCPSQESVNIRLEQVFAGSANVLSILGAFLVILSFLYDTKASSWREIYYKFCCGYQIRDGVNNQIRSDGSIFGSKYRLRSFNVILIQLSVADIIMAFSHLWGLWSNPEGRFANFSEGAPSGQDANCVTQAAFTVFSTISSFLWRDILAVFLAFNVVFAGCSNNFMTGLKKGLSLTKQDSIVVPENAVAPHCCESPFFLQLLFPLIGWGIPLLLVVILAAKDLLGYTDGYDPGWCYVYFKPNSSSMTTFKIDAYSYEVWVWASIILVLLCTTIYTITVCFRRKKHADFHTNCTEVRYLSVGIAFALLRLPMTAVDIYTSIYTDSTPAILNIISSITLSLQGGVNGLIFLCCRSSVKKKCCCPARSHSGRVQEYSTV